MTIKKAGRPAGKTGQAKVLDDKELIRVLKVVAAGNHAKRNTAIVIMSNYLGLRSMELAALKISDILEHDSVKGVLCLVAAYTKGGKHRDVPLSNGKVVKTLQEYIAARRVEDGLTFNIDAPLFRSQKGTAFSPNAMVRVLCDIYKSAGFNDASSHTGRRSMITNLAYTGFDLNSIRQAAGHSSISTTQRYIDDNPHKIADMLMSL